MCIQGTSNHGKLPTDRHSKGFTGYPAPLWHIVSVGYTAIILNFGKHQSRCFRKYLKIKP